MKKCLEIIKYLNSLKPDNEFEKFIIKNKKMDIIFYSCILLLIGGIVPAIALYFGVVRQQPYYLLSILFISFLYLGFKHEMIMSFYSHSDLIQGYENLQLSWSVIIYEQVKRTVHASQSDHHWYKDSFDVMLKYENIYYPKMYDFQFKSKEITERLGVHKKYHTCLC